VACIGPITAETAESYGLTVGIRAKENTIPALAEAIVGHFIHRVMRESSFTAQEGRRGQHGAG